ncbi:hypothetical protein ACFZDJ_53285 [Streptomyces sp. NPDC007896]
MGRPSCSRPRPVPQLDHRRDFDAAAATTKTLDGATMVESGRCASLLTDLATELDPHRAARPVGAALDRFDGVSH